MPIQILPAILANQIAAGEVVERPASVVKELVENSLDSGASLIEIEIEKGGHKQILVRDDGSGIPKKELALALSRHATSKITSLDDLEQIASLGFRGEALASISSVARLSLSSRTAEQSEAWQAYCEGRDMAVQLKPVAHPKGTSVDVVDLFFNTPARRKFLRAEKTEFSHIDEIIRRIALSRFDVAFSLKHNGKLLRKYAAADNEQARQKRLVSICGQDFAENAIALNSQYQDFSLQGWLARPESARLQVDCQYFYVNGRMMRDKLLNHAVRQALEGVIAPEHQLAYVLYFNLSANQVDVNVHPAKHEVRFHQSRLVHDFIYRALSDAINQYFSASTVNNDSVSDSATSIKQLSPVEPNHSYIQALQPADPGRVNDAQQTPNRPNTSEAGLYSSANRMTGSHSVTASQNRPVNRPNIGQASHNYQTLLSTHYQESASFSSYMQIDEHTLLVTTTSGFYKIRTQALLTEQLTHQYSGQLPVSQPLLLPVSIAADEDLLNKAKALADLLLQISIDISWQAKRIILRQVPAGMRQYNWSAILDSLLHTSEPSLQALKNCLIGCLVQQHESLSAAQIDDLWRGFCQRCPQPDEQQLLKLGSKVPLQQWLASYD